MSYLYTQDSERHKILKKFIYGDKSSSIFFFLSFLAIIPSVYLVIQYGNYLYAILNYVLFYCALVLFGKKGGVFEKFSNGYSNDNITLQKNRYIFGLNDSFHLFEGVSLRGRFVENILVCPSGIFIISENKSEGLITVRDNTIYLNSDTVISGLFQDVWMQYFALRDFFGKKRYFWGIDHSSDLF